MKKIIFILLYMFSTSLFAETYFCALSVKNPKKNDDEASLVQIQRQSATEFAFIFKENPDYGVFWKIAYEDKDQLHLTNSVMGISIMQIINKKTLETASTFLAIDDLSIIHHEQGTCRLLD
jgi:hypothetical protein